MTKYLGMNAKNLLTNPYLIFWSVLFMEFWVVLWAFAFTVSLPPIEEVLRTSVATAWGSLAVYSLSAAASSIAMTLLYSSKSVRYVTKYTKLSPSRFLLENLLSSLTVLATIYVIMFLSVVLAFYGKHGMILLPVDPVGLLFSAFLGILFLYALSLFLNLIIVVLRAPRSASFISFLPLMLGTLSYVGLWIDYGIIAYISPFNCLMSLGYYYYSGRSAPTGNFLMPGTGALMDMPLVMLSLITWVVFLLAFDVVLLRKMRGVGVEDIRVA
nr:hypothetical protein [Candidatus Njordarchaeota archaeon]